MFGSSLVFNSPWFLVLLAIVPLLWWTGRTTMAAMGRLRALIAVGLRTVVVAMFVLALAETQTRQTSRAVSVVYLLDQSLSIPAAERHAMFQYVVRAVETHRQAARGDRVGIIVFGREAPSKFRWWKTTSRGCGPGGATCRGWPRRRTWRLR
jgi:hypothetical protein